MEFREIQKGVVSTMKQYGREFNVVINEDYSLIKISEEVGELMQAVLIHRKQCRPEKYLPQEISKQHVAKELADVIGMALVAAQAMDIDIEEAIQKKWIDLEWIEESKRGLKIAK